MITRIDLDSSYRHHRKTLRLQRTIGKDARWIPVWLWLYTVENAQDDGNLSHLTDEDLAAVLEFDGDGKKLREAMIDAGFITADGVVVGWHDRYAERFAYYQHRAREAARARWAKHHGHKKAGSKNTSNDSTSHDISKHGQASSKDASGMLEVSTAAGGPENAAANGRRPRSNAPEATQQPRRRNPLFDALARACGCNPTEVVGAAATKCGVALAAIRKATPDVTGVEIERRAGNYTLHFKDAPLTYNALSNHWAKCNRPPSNGQPIKPPPPPRAELT